MLGKLSLAVFSVLLTLAAFEIGIRIGAVPLPENVVSTAWWKEHWLRERRGGNPREFVQLDPLLGWIPAPNLDEVEYEGVRISTNSSHMRGRREIPAQRTGVPRLAAVGDSYTFGQCVEDHQTFPAVLGRRLGGAEVMNLGVMGYGQDQALLRMQRDALPRRPDYVVFGFHPSNMRRNTLRFRDYAKPRFHLADDGETLELANVPVPPPSTFEGLWPPRLWNYLVMLRDSIRFEQRDTRDHMRALSAAILDRMAADARAGGSKLVVVYLPFPGNLDNPGRFGWPMLAELCDEAEREGRYLCVDPVPRLRELLPTRKARRDAFACHFSPKVQRAVGAAVAEALRETDPVRFGANERPPGATPG